MSARQPLGELPLAHFLPSLFPPPSSHPGSYKLHNTPARPASPKHTLKRPLDSPTKDRGTPAKRRHLEDEGDAGSGGVGVGRRLFADRLSTLSTPTRPAPSRPSSNPTSTSNPASAKLAPSPKIAPASSRGSSSRTRTHTRLMTPPPPPPSTTARRPALSLNSATTPRPRVSSPKPDSAGTGTGTGSEDEKENRPPRPHRRHHPLPLPASHPHPHPPGPAGGVKALGMAPGTPRAKGSPLCRVDNAQASTRGKGRELGEGKGKGRMSTPREAGRAELMREVDEVELDVDVDVDEDMDAEEP